MRVHHLNCVSLCPLGGRPVDRRSPGVRARLTCHVLLLELDSELVLVDTGLGTSDVMAPRPRLDAFLFWLLAPERNVELTAIRQIERLGYDARDVRHIVLTHLDFDHAGGLGDFPWAYVHVLESERKAAVAQRTLLDRMRYRPQQWRDHSGWRTYLGGEGEAWFGFDCVRDLDGLPPELLLVPLIGHTLGHTGVAVDRGDGWLLHAGDAYFFHGELDPVTPRSTAGLRALQWWMQKNAVARVWNRARLRELVRSEPKEVTVFSSHDALEFEALARGADDEPSTAAAHPRLSEEDDARVERSPTAR